MKLLIEKSLDYNDDFVEWLLGVIRDDVLTRINENYLDNMEYYLNTMLSNSTLSNDKVDLYAAILQILDHLEYINGFSHYHIQINPIARLSGTKFKLLSIAKFINYGNQDMPGCGVFTESFSRIGDNLTEYYRTYLMNTGVR